MAFSDDITAYFTNYILVPSSFADAGDTGLTTGKAYVCLRVEDITHITEAQAAESGGSSSFRQLAFALAKALYDAVLGITADDRPTKLNIYLKNYNSDDEDADVRMAVDLRADLTSDDMTVVSE